MTEAEWLESRDVWELAREFGEGLSERKARLFAVACCRRVRHLREDQGTEFLELAERRAEGEATDEDPTAVPEPDPGSARHFENATRVAARPDISSALWELCRSAALVRGCAAYHVWAEDDGIATGAMMDARAAESTAQMHLLREIVGNPFRPPRFDPAWRTANAVALARTAYDARDFGTLPILADALADAGCDDADILGHLRGPGPHVRGCWALDLVLGKD